MIVIIKQRWMLSGFFISIFQCHNKEREIKKRNIIGWFVKKYSKYRFFFLLISLFCLFFLCKKRKSLGYATSICRIYSFPFFFSKFIVTIKLQRRVVVYIWFFKTQEKIVPRNTRLQLNKVSFLYDNPRKKVGKNHGFGQFFLISEVRPFMRILNTGRNHGIRRFLRDA